MLHMFVGEGGWGAETVLAEAAINLREEMVLSLLKQALPEQLWCLLWIAITRQRWGISKACKQQVLLMGDSK